MQRLGAIRDRARHDCALQCCAVVVERLGSNSQTGFLRAVEQDLQVLLHVARGVTIEVVEGDFHRDHAIHRRQLAVSDPFAHLRQLPHDIRAAAQAEVVTPDLAVIQADVSHQYMETVLLIRSESALIKIPEWRSQKRRHRTGNGGDIGATIRERLLQLLRVQMPVIGMSRCAGMEAQNVTLIVFALHDRAAKFAAAGATRAGLYKEHCLDAGLDRIVGKIVENRFRRIEKAGCAGAVVKGQQETNRRLYVEALFGQRRQCDRRRNTATQAERDSKC